jgi:G3E family GTPase
MLADGALTQRWGLDEARQSRLVFIGRNLDESTLRSGFANCQAQPNG